MDVLVLGAVLFLLAVGIGAIGLAAAKLLWWVFGDNEDCR